MRFDEDVDRYRKMEETQALDGPALLPSTINCDSKQTD
jgi:hypothetical protein